MTQGDEPLTDHERFELHALETIDTLNRLLDSSHQRARRYALLIIGLVLSFAIPFDILFVGVCIWNVDSLWFAYDIPILFFNWVVTGNLIEVRERWLTL